MCALFGWLDYKGITSNRTLKKLTQALAISAEERGTDATGISYVYNDKIKIFKRPKPAHKLRFNIPQNTTVVMGHTRLATQGSEIFNCNNHPFKGSVVDCEFALAHNGVLSNDKELHKKENLPITPIKTDSYVAVQLLEKSGKLNFNSIKQMAEAVQGSFTFTVLTDNNKLYFVKGSNPLYLIHFKNLGLYVYASTKSIATNALKACNMNRLTYSVIESNDGDILSIDRYGNIDKERFTISSVYDFVDYYSLYDDLVSDDELTDILEMCNLFNMDEDTVFELLEYGYTCEDIEELMMNPTLLKEITDKIVDF